MKAMLALALCTALALPFASSAQHAHPMPSFTAAAIANPARPASDKALDADRKPLQVLQFTGITHGQKVVDLMPGAGYYTRLFSSLVGTQGTVYALVPNEAAKSLPKIKALTSAAPYTNVQVLEQPIAKLDLPQGLDVVWTSMNYHDMHDPFMGSPDVVAIDKAIFAALKPGGTFIILDHAAAAGSGLSATNTLHRIDPATVKQELASAGFEFVGESKVLANPDDDHTKPVFDASIKGHTDRFIYKFQKPMH